MSSAFVAVAQERPEWHVPISTINRSDDMTQASPQASAMASVQAPTRCAKCAPVPGRFVVLVGIHLELLLLECS
jgi:hypothetical protein